MSAFSSTIEIDVFNWIAGIPMPSPPPTLNVALHTADPLDDGTGGGEVTGGGYVRQSFTFGNRVTINGIGTSSTNDTTIIFGPATSLWGSITYWTIRNSITGAIILHGAFKAARLIEAGDSFTIPLGTLEITIA